MRNSPFILSLLAVFAFNQLSQAQNPTEGAVVFSAGSGLKGPGSSKVIFITGGKHSAAKNLCSQKGMNFRISPDGDFVAFDDNKIVYICELKENAQAVKVADGACPFWVGSGSNKKLFWGTLPSSSSVSFGSGNSYLQAFNPSTKQLTGAKEDIKFNGKSSAMKGGMDLNGVYACTGYKDAVIAKAGGSSVGISGAQKCNPSISPKSGKAMFLDNTDHNVFGVYDASGKSLQKIKPGGVVQNPEWSTDESWLSWVTGDHAGKDVVIGKFSGGKSTLYEGDATFPHLYVGKINVPSTIDFKLTPNKRAKNEARNLLFGKIEGKRGTGLEILVGKRTE